METKKKRKRSKDRVEGEGARQEKVLSWQPLY